MSIKLYSPQSNPRGAKVLVAAQFAKVSVEHVVVTYEDLKKPEHLKRNPLGKVPVVETSEGFLFESNAILRYIARLNSDSQLYGKNSYENSLVDQWLDFTSGEIDPLLYPLVIPILGLAPYDAELNKKSADDLNARVTILDAHLTNKKFLVGDQLTIADIALAVSFSLFYTFFYDENDQNSRPHVLAWYKSIESLSQWREILGRTRFLKKKFPIHQAEQPQKQQVEEKKDQTQQAKKEQPKKEQKPKEEKPKKEVAPKKEAPKKEAPKKEEPKKEDEEEEEAPKKAKNPLDLLPPSPFNLDDYKRQFFLNQNDIAGQIKFLFENVDVEGWSLWIVRYEKAEGEGKMLLKTSNTMNGFLQRTDPNFRKYSFAIHGVYGDNNDFDIAGAWLWRGVEIPLEMKDHPSFEYHSFQRIDPKNPEQSALFAEYWIHQTEDESKVQGKTLRACSYWR